MKYYVNVDQNIILSLINWSKITELPQLIKAKNAKYYFLQSKDKSFYVKCRIKGNDYK